MNIKVNGKQINTSSETLGELINELNLSGKWLAIAINGKVIPKSKVTSFKIKEGDNIDIFAPTGGG